MARKGNLLASIAALRRARRVRTYRSVVIHTVLLGPSGKTIRGWQRVNAQPNTVFTDQGVDDVLTAAVAQTEEMYPGREFRLIPLRDGSFSFVEQRIESAWPKPLNEQNA